MSRFFIICFDIANTKRLRKVAIALENVGERIQHSVFECFLSNADLVTLKQHIAKIIVPEEDHIRYYGLCHKDQAKVLLQGAGKRSQERDFYLL